MKLKGIALVTSIMLGVTTLSFANTDTMDTSVSTDNTAPISGNNSIFTAIGNTPSDLMNDNNTWGPQDRTGQWYVGIGANALINSFNSKGSNFTPNFLVGYNINKYFAVQYNQLTPFNGMFAGLGEGVINFSNNTMFTPYAVGGAGWGNLAGNATGAWDVGGGMKFELSRSLQASIDYRYIQTMAPNAVAGMGQQAGAKAATNTVGAGLTWFFGGDDSATNTGNIQDTGAQTAAETIPTIDETKYVLPVGIKQCEGNFNLTKDGVACYTVDGNNVTVYLDTKFAYDSNDLNVNDKQAIRSFVKFVKDSDINNVTVNGFASKGKTGSAYEAYNQKLSEQRAEAVSQYMQDLGLSKSKIKTVGFGYENPLVPNTTKENMAYNQRVQASVSAPLKQEKK